jgi:hypothetical protein
MDKFLARAIDEELLGMSVGSDKTRVYDWPS